MHALPLEEAEDLPLAVIYYVARTLQPLVLHNAAEDRTYAADRYIRARKPKSILCLPILHQDKLLAIVYLENNLIPGAFTTDRLELLNVLTSQAAISMEIARHIEQVGEQERLKKEMEVARRIQTAMLPHHVEHPEFEDRSRDARGRGSRGGLLRHPHRQRTARSGSPSVMCPVTGSRRG